MIAIVDYGVGNLFSLSASLKALGIDAVVTGDRKKIAAADKIILPGVGAFGDAKRNLDERDLTGFIKDQASNGKPLLGICLGMQLLSDVGYEYGMHEGLGLIPGEVRPLTEAVKGLKVPAMGWNALKIVSECPILKYTSDGEYVYYVHSFYVPKGEYTAAYSEYGTDVSGVTRNGNVYGAQFHPEKSGATGLKILKAFEEL